MSLITYVPAPGYTTAEKGVINQGGGATFDVGAALTSGGGVITVDDTVNPGLVSVLDRYPGLIRNTVTPGPTVNQDTVRAVMAHSIRAGGSVAVPGDYLVLGSDGLYRPSVGGGSLTTYTLEDSYGAPASGDVTTYLQAAVNDILSTKGSGRLQLQNRAYNFNDIVWPSIGLDKPTAVIEFVGAAPLQTVGFMPGVGLTLAQGKDMPAPAAGTILKSTLASGSAFGNISAISNVLAVFRNLVVRVPTNPQWHGIDAGWIEGLVCDNVIVDQGRSWGDGSNPLSPGPIIQPTNTGVVGVIYPGGGNGGVCVARDLLVTGYYTGLTHSEHFDGDRVTLAKNIVGYQPTEGYHSSRIGRMSLYWNKYGIQPVIFTAGHPNTRLAIAEIDYEEDAVGGNWYTTTYHINDPGNLLRGDALVHRVIPAVGPTFSLAVRGGAYFNTSPVTNRASLVDSVGFDGADSATVLPASWAGQPAAQLHGAWGISGQRAYIGTISNTAAGDLATWETGLTNPAIRCRVKLPTTVAQSNLGLTLFGVDSTNWIGVFITNNGVSIQKSDTGAWTNLSGTQTVPGTMVGGQEIDLQVAVLGRTIRAYLDGTLRASYTMTAAEWTKYSASTSHGFMAYTLGYEPGGANGGRWDSLKIERARALAA